MSEYKLGPVETRFAELIWQNEPIPSSLLAKLAEEALQWKKSTTYTILKRFCDRGIFENAGGTVRSLISKEQFYALQSEKFVEETFDGSLPAFVAAFGSRRSLSNEEADALMKLIESMRR